MIGFRNNRPLLKLGDCLITEYGEQCLEHAARRAGTTLPFKDDLLASVRYYLEHECDLSVMQVSELYERLRRMLTEVGLAHLARELKEETPPMTVSVAEIARSVPFWLFFACELKKQVEELQVHGITKYCFTGRKECVMALQGRKRWDRSCQTLLEDLDFLLSRYEEQEAEAYRNLILRRFRSGMRLSCTVGVPSTRA